MIFTLFYVFYNVGQYIAEHLQNAFKKKNWPEYSDVSSDEEDENNKYTVVKYDSSYSDQEDTITFTPPASIQRYREVEHKLRDSDLILKKVVEFGCAGLKFAKNIKNVHSIEHVVFVDLNREVLEESKYRIEPIYKDYDCLREKQLTMEIYEGSVTEYNEVLDDTDAVVCIELIEHLYFPDVEGMVKNIFGNIQPKLVVITTPNKDFNVVFKMKPTDMRHWDHKFEWTRKEFKDWADNVIKNYPEYEVICESIVDGPLETVKLGGCSQIAVFTRHTNTKKPVNAEHGIYKSVHEKQIYPYLSEDLVYECIQNFLTEYEVVMNNYKTNRRYFLNSNKLKKSLVKFEYFDLHSLKSSIHHKIRTDRLLDICNKYGIGYEVVNGSTKILFPYIDGEVEYEDSSDEEIETKESSDESSENDNVNTNFVFKNNEIVSEHFSASQCNSNGDELSDEDGFDYVTTTDENLDVETHTKEKSADLYTINKCPLKRSHSIENITETFPEVKNLNTVKSCEGTEASVDVSDPSSNQTITPLPKKPCLDDQGYSFCEAFQDYNSHLNTSFSITSSTPKNLKSNINEENSKNDIFKFIGSNITKDNDENIHPVVECTDTKNVEKITVEKLYSLMDAQCKFNNSIYESAEEKSIKSENEHDQLVTPLESTVSEINDSMSLTLKDNKDER